MTTIPFEVRNCFTGEVQFTAEIACSPDTLPSVKLGLAVKWATKEKAYLTDADLAGANLAGAYLGAEVLRPFISGSRRSGRARPPACWAIG
jgi:uncharacterized protein YjbI with pentapeptide repeats